MKLLRTFAFFSTLLTSTVFAQNIACDDLSTFQVQTSYATGDTIGSTFNGNEYMIAQQGSIMSNQYSNAPGVYLISGSVEHQVSTQYQNKVYTLYGPNPLSSNQNITINGSLNFSMDTVFPIITSGFTVDVNQNLPNIGNFPAVFLSIHGNINSVEIDGFELGIKDYCTGDNNLVFSCEDFTSSAWPSSTFYANGDTIIAGQSNIDLMTSVGVTEINYGTNSPGLYMVNSGLNIDFVGLTYEVSALFYGFYGQYSQSNISVNGNSLQIPFDTTFPLFLGNVQIDLDTSYADFGNWEVSKLTITGDVQSITLHGFESGISNLCTQKINLVLGTENEKETQFTLYPNPAAQEINIENQSPIAAVYIYNTQGALLKEIPADKAFNVRVSLEDLAPGMYVVKIQDSKGKVNVSPMIKD